MTDRDKMLAFIEELAEFSFDKIDPTPRGAAPYDELDPVTPWDQIDAFQQDAKALIEALTP